MAEEGGVEYVEAEDGEAVQALFEKYCDDDGLMTKAAVKAVPSITDLLVRIVTKVFYTVLRKLNPAASL